MYLYVGVRTHACVNNYSRKWAVCCSLWIAWRIWVRWLISTVAFLHETCSAAAQNRAITHALPSWQNELHYAQWSGSLCFACIRILRKRFWQWRKHSCWGWRRQPNHSEDECTPEGTTGCSGGMKLIWVHRYSMFTACNGSLTYRYPNMCQFF